MRASRYAAAALVAAMASAASPNAEAAELTIGRDGLADIRDGARDADAVRARVSQVRPIPEGNLALLGCNVFGGPRVVFLQVADGSGLLRQPRVVGESCAEILDELLAGGLDIDETRTVKRSVARGTFEILVWVLIRP